MYITLNKFNGKPDNCLLLEKTAELALHLEFSDRGKRAWKTKWSNGRRKEFRLGEWECSTKGEAREAGR